MTTYQGHLACGRCSTVVDERAFMYGCPACAAEGRNVNVHPVYALTADAWHCAATEPGIFEWRSLLPVPASAPVVSLGEGRTPLVRLDRTAARYGMTSLLVKDETRNPTWSYKDRLAAVAVTKARADGADTVVVATTGNHGAATAAYAAAAGLRCVALTLASVPLTMKVLMQAYGAEVVAVEHPRDRWALMKLAVEEWGWVPVSGFVDPPIGSNPFGIDGYKSIAYELFDELGGLPDTVIVPTAYADALTGIFRGFVDLRELGLTSRVPKMVVSEPLGPYAASLAAAPGNVSSTESRPSVAFSIAGNIATAQGVSALRESGGSSVVVGDDEAIIAEQLAVASSEGLYLEASSITAVSAARLLARDRLIEAGETVVAIGSSTGLKDIGVTAARLDDVPVIAPSLAALAERIRPVS